MNWLVRLVIQLRLKKLNAKREFWALAADKYRRNARELSLKAYALDPVERPLAWGRLQNDANWAKHYERLSHKEVKKLTDKIEVLKGRLYEYS